jgi:hypothetical protein
VQESRRAGGQTAEEKRRRAGFEKSGREARFEERRI